LEVEFKGEEHSAFNDRDLIKEVVCLSNRGGNKPGYLIIGVEDDGRITGARPRHELGIIDPSRIQALVANRTRPSLSCRVEFVSYQKKTILIIEVPTSRTPVATSEGTYLRRAIGGKGKPECLPFHFHEMQAYQADRGILDYSALIVPEASWEHLDPIEFERFRRNIQESRGFGDPNLLGLPDAELAKALGAVTANHEIKGIRVLGLLLFGKEQALRQFLPTHEIAFQRISGLQVEVNEFLRYPLLRVMEEMLTRFRARNREEEIMVGMLRVGVPDYSEQSFREGLANALIHRDYTRQGAVHIQWHDDRIEISNPGGFPEGVRLDNLLVTPPRPRNPLLADAFKRAGLVERTGRGIDTIFYQQLRNGRPIPSYEKSTETDVILELPGGKANLHFVRLATEESQAGRVLSLNALLVLNRMWSDRRITADEAMKLIQRSETEGRAVLESLVENGLVESRGERKGRSYHLSATTYRRLGEKAAYIRQRGFEPLQQEQMIIQYLEKNKRISRAEAAELCRAGPYQATRLLKKLVKEKKILMHGTKKGAWYSLCS
jgi:ATP-dependent DNA helicase RecG